MLTDDGFSDVSQDTTIQNGVGEGFLLTEELMVQVGERLVRRVEDFTDVMRASPSKKRTVPLIPEPFILELSVLRLISLDTSFEVCYQVGGFGSNRSGCARKPSSSRGRYCRGPSSNRPETSSSPPEEFPSGAASVRRAGVCCGGPKEDSLVGVSRLVGYSTTCRCVLHLETGGHARSQCHQRQGQGWETIHP